MEMVSGNGRLDRNLPTEAMSSRARDNINNGQLIYAGICWHQEARNEGKLATIRFRSDHGSP